MVDVDVNVDAIVRPCYGGRVSVIRRTSLTSLPWLCALASTASDDDINPLIRVWDLRSNTTTPLAELRGHTKGVMSVSWCTQDSGLLLSCGKDNRTLLWDMQVGQLIYEVPANAHGGAADSGLGMMGNSSGAASLFGGMPSLGSSLGRRYEVKWSPKQPGIVGSCSFDRCVRARLCVRVSASASASALCLFVCPRIAACVLVPWCANVARVLRCQNGRHPLAGGDPGRARDAGPEVAATLLRRVLRLRRQARHVLQGRGPVIGTAPARPPAAPGRLRDATARRQLARGVCSRVREGSLCQRPARVLRGEGGCARCPSLPVNSLAVFPLLSSCGIRRLSCGVCLLPCSSRHP